VWELPLGKELCGQWLGPRINQITDSLGRLASRSLVRHKSLGYQGVSITLRFNGFLGNARSPAAIFLELLAPTSDKTSIFLMARL